jgi:peptide/nickel transport system substrate-binding protein
MSSASGPFRTLYDQLVTGQISRRTFLQRATAAGISASVAMYVASVAATAQSTPAASPSASPAASGGAGMASGTPRPTTGTESQERGSGGELKLIQWQAPSQLSPHVAAGDKDILAASLVLEPLMHYGEDAGLLANLITEVPSFANGQLAEDLTSVTFSLLPDVTWSDGTPFTSADLRFTWNWYTNTENSTTNTDEVSKIA